MEDQGSVDILRSVHLAEKDSRMKKLRASEHVLSVSLILFKAYHICGFFAEFLRIYFGDLLHSP